MNFFISNFKWIMLLSGVLTFTMLSGLISPQSQLNSTFGSSIEGPAAEIIVRNWSALIGLMGVMLIYGAFAPAVRRFTLVIAGISKAVFIMLILTYGKSYMQFGAGTAVIADSIMVILYVAYLYLSKATSVTG